MSSEKRQVGVRKKGHERQEEKREERHKGEEVQAKEKGHDKEEESLVLFFELSFFV